MAKNYLEINIIVEDIIKKLSLVRQKDSDILRNSANALIQLNKELDAQLSFVQNKAGMETKLPSLEHYRKLQIGGGKRTLEGYVNVDIFPPSDLIWDVRSGLPFQNERFDEIFSEHFLEHLDFPRSAILFLTEAFRTLKIGGELKIVVPDCGQALREYVANNKTYFQEMARLCFANRDPQVEINGNIDLVNYLFRDQFDNPKYTVHWWGYDYDNLSAMLKKAGFVSVDRWGYDPKMCNPKRQYYSLYIIAKK